MVKKNDDESKDLTRIEDLSEFLHQDDESLDSKFNGFDSPNLEVSGLKEISQLLDETPLHEPLSEEIDTLINEDQSELLTEENSFSFEDQSLDESLENTLGDLTSSFNDVGQTSELDEIEDVELPVFEDKVEDSYTPHLDDLVSSTHIVPPEIHEDEMTPDDSTKETPHLVNDSERFLDVKTFAQNFSYGKSSGVGGNPPFSLIARNIKYKEEAEDILNLLSELGLVNASNEKEISRSLELGSLLVPQISEYAAIVVAHKLRRFDLDLEVGLTDEVHPSKSGEVNPRGLIKKENIRQNRSEREEISEFVTNINDILMTTAPMLQGHMVNEFLGVKSTFTIIEETELEKLQYVQKTLRDNAPLIDLENSSEESLTSIKAFRDFNDSFILVYDELLNQLKQKALTLKANALLGINYQVTPLHFDRAQKHINAYQVTCSATMAYVVKENL